jgi:hypothetical protein
MPVYIRGKGDIVRGLEEASPDDEESLKRLCRTLVATNYYDEITGQALRAREIPSMVDRLGSVLDSTEKELGEAMKLIEVLRQAHHGSPKDKLAARKQIGEAERLFLRFTNQKLKEWPSRY